MKDQHIKIKGYRDLSQEEIDLMNEGKALGVQLGEWLDKLEAAEFAQTSDQVPSKRELALGRTNLQQGMMWAIRSIAKPTTF
jgi:hypothetical protein